MATQEKTSVNFSRTERSSTRWLMAFYDTIVYILCWWAFFVMHPSVKDGISMPSALVYFVVGYVLFFGMRFVRKAYKQIWRYGSIQAFSKELEATILAGIILVPLGMLIGEFLCIEELPFTSLVSFTTLYIVITIAARFAYYHLYYFAKREGRLSLVVRRALSFFARVDFVSQIPGATLPIGKHIQEFNGPINELLRIIDQFAIRGKVARIEQINKGYINRTYYVETLSERGHTHKYTLQRVNTNVFTDVDALMDNFKLTTEHLYGRLHLPGQHVRGTCHSLRQTKDGKPYLRDESGCWRMLTYFDNVYSVDLPESKEQFFHAGIAFGNFIREMADVKAEDVKIVIPNFHNTLSRYMDLEKSIEKDTVGRVAQVQPEIEFVRARAERYGMISKALESGEIPTRICHNDCNLNNILFDCKTKLPVAVIDLDTVMPSTPLYDFGDSIRIGTNTAADDEKDMSKVSCNLELYEAYARGYLEACGRMLTKKELELLPYAALIITSEDGIRFLMDHIDGDTYYNIYYPGQNLDRSRTQLKLVEDMEKKLPEIEQILKKIYKELGLDA